MRSRERIAAIQTLSFTTIKWSDFQNYCPTRCCRWLNYTAPSTSIFSDRPIVRNTKHTVQQRHLLVGKKETKRRVCTAERRTRNASQSSYNLLSCAVQAIPLLILLSFTITVQYKADSSSRTSASPTRMRLLLCSHCNQMHRHPWLIFATDDDEFRGIPPHTPQS